MKLRNLFGIVIGAILLVIVNGFMLYFYYSEIAYPVEDPTNFQQISEELEGCTVIKAYGDENPFSHRLASYLIETKEGNQKLIIWEIFPYFDHYRLVSVNDVPEVRPCTVSLDFFGRVYDHSLDEENVFGKWTGPGARNIASNVFMFMPLVGFAAFAVEAAVVYPIYLGIKKKKAQTAVTAK